MATDNAAATKQLPDDPSSILNVNVGVLGHVDSGKTSLVKTLSTFLSTAALDKSKQSRQRGMTLDLGFSCFFLDMPEHLEGYKEEKLQMTLVDCPGHASLIRTIIGGAQIIDMVLLVVDAFKGWQAQTTECLVLAELTSPCLVVALNKVDLFEESERQAKIEQAKQDVRARLRTTRFANAKLVGVSACVGGEKVAAVAGGDTSSTALQSGTNDTYNVDTLVHVLQQELPPPKRTREGPFYFSIDHCFPIRGQGTVLTGTVLNGSTSTNSMLEFPTLGLERKIKSMQMFRRKVTSISQGDRAGICVSNFDAKLLERGVAATPGAVQLLKGALALVRKVPYYQGTLLCGAKFHVSVGHTTVMATVTFWGASELAAHSEQSNTETLLPETESSRKKKEQLRGHSSLGGDADLAGLPRLAFDFQQDFVQQNRLLESLDNTTSQDGDTGTSNSTSLLHWALLDFQTPVFCPLDSLVIGSRLDTVDNKTTSTSSSAVSSCRLAFSGRLMEKMDPAKDSNKIRLYVTKERRGVVRRLGDVHRREDDKRIVRYEVFGTDLFKKETNMKLFVGMKLVTERGEVGVIKSSFGTSGKFRVYFPGGTEAREGDALILRFKRYLHDPEKGMHQDMELPPSRSGARLETERGKKEKKGGGGAGKQGAATNIAPSPVSAAEKSTKIEETRMAAVLGEVTLLKGDVLDNGKYPMAIVSGFFTPEVDIREKKGTKVVVPSTKEEGVIAGPFGKAGKCKVSFEEGVSAEIGAKAELHQ